MLCDRSVAAGREGWSSHAMDEDEVVSRGGSCSDTLRTERVVLIVGGSICFMRGLGGGRAEEVNH